LLLCAKDLLVEAKWMNAKSISGRSGRIRSQSERPGRGNSR
jgi:hypothetical protein